MATQVNIFEAKTNLSKLIEQIEQGGEDIVIARAGKPVARLTTVEPAQKPIRFGLMKGEIWVADDFDAPLPDEILREFYEGPIFPPESVTNSEPETADGRKEKP